jgi:hypothetical protein
VIIDCTVQQGAEIRDVIRINRDESANLLSMTPTLVGSVEVSDSSYRFVFPVTGSGNRIEITVNRWTKYGLRSVADPSITPGSGVQSSLTLCKPYEGRPL